MTLAALLIGLVAAQALEIGIIGDSTLAAYEADSPRRGWGQMLPEYLVPGTIILNEGERGKSSKSFPAERWRRILSARPAVVLIQFGHNDEHAKMPLPEYKANLQRYLEEARRAGISPVLVTPMHRRTYKAGQLTDELAPYAAAMKELGAEEKVPVIDLYDLSGKLYVSLGEEDASALTVNYAGGTSKEDRTHFNEQGARKLAALVAAELPKSDPKLVNILN